MTPAGTVNFLRSSAEVDRVDSDAAFSTINRVAAEVIQIAPTSIKDLPPEIFTEVLAHLPGNDLLKASTVCKSWNRVFNQFMSRISKPFELFAPRIAGVTDPDLKASWDLWIQSTNRQYNFIKLTVGNKLETLLIHLLHALELDQIMPIVDQFIDYFSQIQDVKTIQNIYPAHTLDTLFLLYLIDHSVGGEDPFIFLSKVGNCPELRDGKNKIMLPTILLKLATLEIPSEQKIFFLENHIEFPVTDPLIVIRDLYLKIVQGQPDEFKNHIKFVSDFRNFQISDF